MGSTGDLLLFTTLLLSLGLLMHPTGAYEVDGADENDVFSDVDLDTVNTDSPPDEVPVVVPDVFEEFDEATPRANSGPGAHSQQFAAASWRPRSRGPPEGADAAARGRMSAEDSGRWEKLLSGFEYAPDHPDLAPGLLITNGPHRLVRERKRLVLGLREIVRFYLPGDTQDWQEFYDLELSIMDEEFYDIPTLAEHFHELYLNIQGTWTDVEGHVQMFQPVRNAFYTIYHRKFFEWHAKHFYPLDHGMSQAETDYLNACLRLTGFEQEGPWSRLSHYTYSHRYKNGRLDSSRFAWGTLTFPLYMWDQAKKVLDERQISIGPDITENANLYFYGLGWEHLTGKFKVYFRFLDMNFLSDEHKKLGAVQEIIDGKHGDYEREGLISWTYDKQGSVVEEKVYTYPARGKQTEGAPQVATNLAKMHTTGRGLVPQYDVPPGESLRWIDLLNDAGQNVLKKYRKDWGVEIDTIVYYNKDDYTLYFEP